jgi:hypothetical protein
MQFFVPFAQIDNFDHFFRIIHSIHYIQISLFSLEKWQSTFVRHGIA